MIVEETKGVQYNPVESYSPKLVGPVAVPSNNTVSDKYPLRLVPTPSNIPTWWRCDPQINPSKFWETYASVAKSVILSPFK